MPERPAVKLNEKGGQVELERLRDENAKLREALALLRGQVAGEREVYLERDGTKESDKYAVYMQGLLDKASAMSLPGVRYRITIPEEAPR